MDIIKTDEAPELTQDDIDELLLRGEDLDLWKSKFPPNSYILKGFGIMNLYDATLDVTIAKIRSLFLRKDVDVFDEFKDNMRALFGINDLQIGFSLYNIQTQESLSTFMNKETRSLFMENEKTSNYEKMFCDGVCKYVMQENQAFAIPDIKYYGQRSGKNKFYRKLKSKGIKSIILAPIPLENGILQMLEIASPRSNDLNSLNATKLLDIIPFVKIASERFYEETENRIESTIQEIYTSIHPSVKWRFIQAANNYIQQKAEGENMPVLEEIVFENIYPLYGQSDIKGSSMARNNAIKADLELQLSLVIDTLKKIISVKPMPIYKKLIFRVNNYLDSVKDGLHAGDEVGILEFLKNEIYPVFNHLKTLNSTFQQAVEDYLINIDPDLNVVYKQRRAYDESVGILNDNLSAVLDQKQDEAQEMFPHYFQRYNTDGVEFNIYIGEALVEDDKFDMMYLHNLRLWQLETMWAIEQRAFELEQELPHPLKVASLILIHNASLGIKFKMDEKQFDVDGAYNARYEIIKKRIDKSYIKGTRERLTQPGKLAIVYSHERDAQEYLQYLHYLQERKLFGEIEMLVIEDLQGVSGLKAIRAEILYVQPSEVNKVDANGQKAATSKINVDSKVIK
jgi:hypothetical protein